jgi:hypothetical protein
MPFAVVTGDPPPQKDERQRSSDHQPNDGKSARNRGWFTRILLDNPHPSQICRCDENSRCADAPADEQETVTDQPYPEVVIREFLPFQR